MPHDLPYQSDDEFVVRCRMPDVPFAAAFALAVRSEVADRARVPPHSVRADDRLPEDLGDLFNRASLDAVEFVMQLENDFSVVIPDWTMKVFIQESVSVAELASRLCRGAIERKRKSGTTIPGEGP